MYQSSETKLDLDNPHKLDTVYQPSETILYLDDRPKLEMRKMCLPPYLTPALVAS